MLAFTMPRPNTLLEMALLNTSARPDSDEAKQKRKAQIAKAEQGKFAEIIEGALPAFVHPIHKDDKNLQEIITAAHNDTGAEAYIRQQTAILERKDSCPNLKDIHIPTLVLTGDEDKLIALALSEEITAAIAIYKFKEHAMKSLIMWLFGVPVSIIIFFNLFF